MNVIVWNCRGADNKIFRRNFREIIRTHRPDVVALFETKVLFNSIGLFFNDLGYTASTIVDPVGCVGGIWFLWNPIQVLVSAHIANHQVIQAMVQRKNYEDWVLGVVYASPNIRLRQNLWHELEDTASSMTKPWLLTGDFNEISSNHERRSFTPSNQQTRSRRFLDQINLCGLMDLGCTRPKLTWINNRKGLSNTIERLDRALCNAEWCTLFPDGTVQNLRRTYSDHSPLIAYTEGISKLSPCNRPFRFEAAWLSHPQYRDVIYSSWDHNQSLSTNLLQVANDSLIWNKEIFGNIFKSKRCLLSRIEGIQKALANHFSHNLFLLEKDLIRQFNKTLLQEEILWFQKSRVNWITQGERNTKYFHVFTITKCKRIKIDSLLYDTGNWIMEAQAIKTHIQDYFIALFQAVPTVKLSHWNNIATHTFSPKENHRLTRDLTNYEIWKATKHINAFKAPSRDGFQAIFYHKFWDIIDQDWYGETTIASQCPGDHTSNYLKVVEVIKEDGSWNLDSLTEFIPQSILLDISQIHLPQFVEALDNPTGQELLLGILLLQLWTLWVVLEAFDFSGILLKSQLVPILLTTK
ncbi:uncharacterized protein LOC114300374 [Camellia sinensis]|uniref:uncharacterized protein LOC114300374 n=1 Tax=Camellia sinensis TaxID=4442 RepID=UPI001035D675|nr:uncharacterized protein LOC114300374 [Camellia sinensis]